MCTLLCVKDEIFQFENGNKSNKFAQTEVKNSINRLVVNMADTSYNILSSKSNFK